LYAARFLLVSVVCFSFALSAKAAPPFLVFEPHDHANGKNIVLISGDEEYRSEESLPQLAKILAAYHGFRCTVLFAIDPQDGTINPERLDNIPGLEALDSADLMVILTRFRDLPDSQMKHIVDYVESGRPIVGIRTATHAFALKTSLTYARYNWNEPSGGFGRLVLGETWVKHHGEHGKQSTRGVLNASEAMHPILTGIHDGDLWSTTDVYETRLPLPGDSKTLVYGQVLSGMHPEDAPVSGAVNNPMMPIAWVRSHIGAGGKAARVFTTTLGTSADLLVEGDRRLLVNACYWALGLERQIRPDLNVGLVGDYHPRPFGFGGFTKGLAPSDLLTNSPSGQQLFNKNCASCHGADARGTAKGPGLAMNPRVAGQTTEQLRAFLGRGNPAAGMPAFSDLPDSNLIALAKYLRRINVETITAPASTTDSPRKMTWGPPRPGDWLTYNGNDSGNRYSPLKQIDTSNVSQLKLKWFFPISYFGLEVTPLAAGGVLYVTGPNQVIALDALTGAAIWRYSRPASSGMSGDARLGTNRGVAILDDKVFFVTDNAHLLALERASGRLLWETSMATGEGQHYGGTLAPLIVDNMVIAGVSGADEGIRGFVAAFHPDTGALLWRHWTVPETPATVGGSTWLTGSYDASSHTLYWPTGNPWPDDEDQNRPGDNLYTNCVLALDPKTGDLKWHYQFTPHDLRDRDATEPNVLVDVVYQGKPSKLLLHADRNGFFYVLDRINGKLLLAKPFLHRIDWASGIGPDGRPVVKDPRGCPDDAANWDSTAFSPLTRLYYFMALEECVGDSPGGYPEQSGQRFLRAINIDTGNTEWEIPQPGPAHAKTWSGVLATAGSLIFYGQPNGGFAAVDQRNGKTLWQFPTNVRMKASPMTFTAGGHQYVAVAAGPNILCFGL
jgi:outer membrane protein assembly factor BamB